ncbi:hypothetical protein OKW30_000691 [Paraburkholderia sp. Clong3]
MPDTRQRNSKLYRLVAGGRYRKPERRNVMDIGSGSASSVAHATSAISIAGNFDQRFALRDGNGRALLETLHAVRFRPGELKHSVTDQAGGTTRYATDGGRNLAVYPGHREA